MEEKESLSLAKSRLYRKIEEIERERQMQPRGSKEPPSPVIPLTVLFLFLIVVIIMEERALYIAEAQLSLLRGTVAEQAETIRLANDRIVAYQQEAQQADRQEPMKRRPVKKRRPRQNAQNELLSGGDGSTATLR